MDLPPEYFEERLNMEKRMKIKYELTKEEVTEIISNYIINKKGNIDVSSISYLCTEHRDNGVGCGWYDLDRVDIICQE